MNRRRFVKLLGGALAYPALPRPSRGASAAESSDPAELTLAEAAAGLRSSAFTSERLTEACLARIGTYDPKLDAFITVMRESALAEARRRDGEGARGAWRGPLHGIPVAVKDNIDTAGTRTTAASDVFSARVPTEDATVVTRLRAAGAVIVGKTNLNEFAMGWGEISFFGPTRNPWNLARSPGGSSSGSAAAISSRLCFGALGTDTGGSIRIPASYCGIVGLKPTYGLVPIRGIVPVAPSYDHCGPMARTVEDAALMLNLLAGYDPLDPTAIEHPREDYVQGLRQPVSGLRLGRPAGFFDNLDGEVAAAVAEAISLLARLARGVKDVALPMETFGREAILAPEVWAYHEQLYRRFPGRYMLRDRHALAGFKGADAAEYVRARQALDLMRRTIDSAFADFDLVVLPTQRILPPLLNDALQADYDNRQTDPKESTNCGYFDDFGLPAISVPCGFSADGLPIGLMIAGPRFSESRVLALAHAYEQATRWHERKPPLMSVTQVPSVVNPAQAR